MKRFFTLFCIVQTIFLISFVYLKKSEENINVSPKIEQFSPKFLPLYENSDTIQKTMSI